MWPAGCQRVEKRPAAALEGREFRWIFFTREIFFHAAISIRVLDMIPSFLICIGSQPCLVSQRYCDRTKISAAELRSIGYEC